MTRRFIFLEEGDIAEITSPFGNIFDNTGAEVKTSGYVESNLQYDAGDKGIYRHYMQKEIYDRTRSKHLYQRMFSRRVDLSELGTERFDELLPSAEHAQILACGTSANSGMVSRYWLERCSGPCDAEIAPEFRHRKSAVRRNSLMITPSQSGETADTPLACVCRKKAIFALPFATPIFAGA